MIITSRKNDAVRRFRDILREKKLRDTEGVFAVEGDHLCGELAKSGFRIISALATENAITKYPQTAQALRSAGEFAVISQEVAGIYFGYEGSAGAVRRRGEAGALRNSGRCRAAGAARRSPGSRERRDDTAHCGGSRI